MVKRIGTGDIGVIKREVLRDLMVTRRMTMEEAMAFYESTGRRGQDAMRARAEKRMLERRRATAGNPAAPRGLAFVRG